MDETGRSSVTLSQNSKGETQISVKAYLPPGVEPGRDAMAVAAEVAAETELRVANQLAESGAPVVGGNRDNHKARWHNWLDRKAEERQRERQRDPAKAAS